MCTECKFHNPYFHKFCDACAFKDRMVRRPPHIEAEFAVEWPDPTERIPVPNTNIQTVTAAQFQAPADAPAPALFPQPQPQPQPEVLAAAPAPANLLNVPNTVPLLLDNNNNNVPDDNIAEAGARIMATTSSRKRRRKNNVRIQPFRAVKRTKISAPVSSRTRSATGAMHKYF